MSSKEQKHSNDKVSSKQQSPKPATKNLDIPAQQKTHLATIIQRARLEPSSLTPREVQQLQRTTGNRAVGGLLTRTGPRPVGQPKLAVGPAGDQYEQEADRVAKQVLSMPGQSSEVQRQDKEGLAQAKPHMQRQAEKVQVEPLPAISTLQRQEEEELGQMKSADSAGTHSWEISSDLEQSIQNARGESQTLDDDIREPMERSFGADFSGVRIHTDAQSDTLNRALQARAFTTRQDIFFRQGSYDPKSAGGKELLAHELTHVVQQNGTALQRREPEREAGTNTASHTASSQIATSAAPGLQKGIIQAWPMPQVNNEPSNVEGFKCHEAVLYWVLLSIDQTTDEDAIKAINMIKKKRGSSINWIAEALNYAAGTRVQSHTEADVGDILFIGQTSPPTAHSMVVIDGGNIKGFNNYGTFGSDTLDKFSTENWADERFWHGGEDDRKLGATEGGQPVYKVSYATAVANLLKWKEETEKTPDRPKYIVGPSKRAKSKCFITTACVEAQGLPDDCEELTVLRAFRDSYLMQKPNGRLLVETYYQYSPRIVDAIAEQKNAASVYAHLYEVIRACVEAIKKGDNEFAYTTYCEMVIKLREQFIPDVAVPSYVL